MRATGFIEQPYMLKKRLLAALRVCAVARPWVPSAKPPLLQPTRVPRPPETNVRAAGFIEQP
eukprot:1083687-Pyramimonas_sp.AAC.1